MIGALWTGISGLSSQQTALDNESNNIANVNTIGYKSSRISFADQMYQDRIGKGSKILDAEKLYVQGNLKLTGVNYDMALSGDGFFTVKNTTQGGNAEAFYTRAGNFRMGDNGTLQDSAGNEVQGWAMRTLTEDDVLSTNPNATMFNDDYSELLGTRVIRHDTYVETITGKSTDYEQTAASDALDVFSGTGLKSKSAKLNDIEELKKDYIQKLQDLKNTPDGPSAASIAQKSQVDFDGSVFKGDGDQISVTINGTKKSQGFVSVTADAALIAELDAAAYPDTTTGGSGAGGAWNQDDYNLAASRIATYKALADKISSEVPGFVAYNVIDNNTAGAFEDDDVFTQTTTNSEVLRGMIEIKSMIPGKDFVVNSVEEFGPSSQINGEINETLSATKAQAGTGAGALESIQEALSRAITGNQRNVYTPSEVDFAQTHSLGFSIYDKNLKRNVEIPDPTAVPPKTAITLPNTGIDATAAALNADTTFSNYLVAENVNGNLVISTKDSYYDVEFSTTLTETSGANAGNVIDKNADYSGRMGAGAEFLQITNTIEQTATQSSLQLKLDSLGLSDSAFGEFSVDNTGLITMKQDGVDFAIGQVSIALFNNNRGLLPSGDNLLAKTTESGDPIYNVNNEKTAKVEGKTLELSTADLSESLVNLMVFQRAFEANAKSITTSDQLLNTLINLKR